LFVLFNGVLSKTHIAEHSKKPIKIKAAKKSIRQVFGGKRAQKKGYPQFTVDLPVDNVRNARIIQFMGCNNANQPHTGPSGVGVNHVSRCSRKCSKKPE
jgi:hypothetical protein